MDASISESVFNMLESCITEVAEAGVVRGPSGSTISDVVPSGTFWTKSGKHVIIGGNGKPALGSNHLRHHALGDVLLTQSQKHVTMVAMVRTGTLH